MSDQRIRVTADVDTRQVDRMRTAFAGVREEVEGIRDAARDIPGGGGGGGGGRRPPTAPGGGGGGAGPMQQRISSAVSNSLQAAGQVLGLAALASPGFALRDATRFGLMGVHAGQRMGITPTAMNAFGRQLMRWGAVGTRFGFRKDEVLTAGEELAQAGMLGAKERAALFANANGLAPMLQGARVLGMEAQEMAGFEGRLMKTFELGPQTMGEIATAFLKGAKLAGLPNRADFVRYATAYAEQFRGLGGKMEEAVGLMAAVQGLMPKAFKGEAGAGVLTSLQQMLQDYIFNAGQGLTGNQMLLFNRAGLNREEAAQNAPVAMSKLLKALMGDPNLLNQNLKSARLAYLSMGLGMSPEQALATDAAVRGNSQATIGRAIEDAMKVGEDPLTRLAKDKEADALSKDKFLRTRAFELNVENQAVLAANQALSVFTGQVKDAGDALAGMTKLTGMGLGGSMMGSAIPDIVGNAVGYMLAPVLGRLGGGLLGKLGLGKAGTWLKGLFRLGGAGAGGALAGGAAGAAGGAAAGLGEAVATGGAMTAGQYLIARYGATEGALAGRVAGTTLLRGSAGAKMALAGMADKMSAVGSALGALITPTGVLVSAVAAAGVGLLMIAKRSADIDKAYAEFEEQAHSELARLRALQGKGPEGVGRWSDELDPNKPKTARESMAMYDENKTGLERMWWGIRSGMDWLLTGGGYFRPENEAERMARQLAGAGAAAGGGGASITYNEQPIQINVNSAREAEQVAKGVESERTRKMREAKANTSMDRPGAYGPYANNYGAQSGVMRE